MCSTNVPSSNLPENTSPKSASFFVDYLELQMSKQSVSVSVLSSDFIFAS